MIDEVYTLAEPYWHTRSGEIHMPESFAMAQRLLEAEPAADPLIVLAGVLLHDVGYARVPAETHHAGLADAPGGWDADVTRRHEREGAVLAAEILRQVGMDEARVARVVEIGRDHLVSARGEGERERAPQPTARARDQYTHPRDRAKASWASERAASVNSHASILDST